MKSINRNFDSIACLITGNYYSDKFSLKTLGKYLVQLYNASKLLSLIHTDTNVEINETYSVECVLIKTSEK